MIIKSVKARKIKDSRGEWTIEVSVNNFKASSPSGKSTGKYESKQYYRSLDFCINYLNKWDYGLEINDFSDLIKIEKIIKKDLKLKNAKEFGGNSLFAFESAILKALAGKKKELWSLIPGKKNIPVPVGNAIGGGLHSSKFKKHPLFQEFLLIPNEKNFNSNLKKMNSIYNKLGLKLRAKVKNDEGAWNVNLNEEEILEIFKEFNIRIGLDIAGSSFYKRGYKYKYKILKRLEQVKYINHLIKEYGIFYVEDPLEENDFSGFSKLKGKLIVGDDLTATQISRVKKAINKKSISAMIIKPNQNGSLLEVAKIFNICRNNKIKTIISHRSGETLDSALADYAYGFGADFIKTGIFGKSRIIKLRRLMKIEKSLNK